jgi:hypothetical protein
MADEKRYQVVGECAHIVATDVSGVQAVILLYRGAFLPDGVEEKRLQHLIDSGLVAEVGDTPIAPNSSEPQDPAVGIRAAHKALGGNTGEEPDGDGLHPAVTDEQHAGQQAKADEEAAAEAERAEARSKLKQNSDGTYQAPHANAGEPVWVEYAVTQGLDRDEATKAGKDQLKALFAKA